VTILIVSPVALFREPLGERLAARAQLRVLEAVSVGAAIPATAAGRPDVVLLDERACTRELVDALRHAFAPVKVLAIGVEACDDAILACARARVDGFVMGEASEQELVHAVACVQRGELACSPRAAALLLREAANGGGNGTRGSHLGLTPREEEIVALLDEGLSNKQIARKLGISPVTDKNHVHRILRKLGVGRRGAAAALVRKHYGGNGAAGRHH